jgi:hypothetical protein
LTVADARRALLCSGADGVMVGRGILRNPWLLRQIAEDITGSPVAEPTLGERRAVLLRYLDEIAARFDGDSSFRDRVVLGPIKKATGYFTRGLPYGARLRESVFHSSTLEEARERFCHYFDLLEERSIVDAFVDVHPEEPDDAVKFCAEDVEHESCTSFSSSRTKKSSSPFRARSSRTAIPS